MSTQRQNEGQPIIDYIQEVGLQSLLPTGTITWEHQSGNYASTVDVILGSEGVVENLEYCRITTQTIDQTIDQLPLATTDSYRRRAKGT
jgi:hypothetical protein